MNSDVHNQCYFLREVTGLLLGCELAVAGALHHVDPNCS